MSSLDPLDPRRLEVTAAKVSIPIPERVTVTVTFAYSPWEPSFAQNALWEQANALLCVNDVLLRGGVSDEL